MLAQKETAIKLINSLSENKLKVALDFLQYLEEKEEWQATEELLDAETIFQIKEGQKQILEGDFVKFKDIRKNV